MYTFEILGETEHVACIFSFGLVIRRRRLLLLLSPLLLWHLGGMITSGREGKRKITRDRKTFLCYILWEIATLFTPAFLVSRDGMVASRDAPKRREGCPLLVGALVV